MSMLRPGIVLLLLLALVTGGVYPLVTTLLGQWWFADKAALLPRGKRPIILWRPGAATWPPATRSWIN